MNFAQHITKRNTNISLMVLAIIAVSAASPLFAQSTRKATGSANKGATGSTNKGATANARVVEMEGYCPVCIYDMKKWIQGKAEFQSTFDGKTYLFPGEKQKQTFDANPFKYVPVLGGDSVIAFKKTGERLPGTIRFAAFHKNRLYLFQNEAAKKEFLENADVYSKADLALEGKCTVCKVEMGKDVDGTAEFSVLFQGIRYYFPGTDQRDMFIANAAKYAVGKSSNQAATKGSTKK